MFTDAQSSFARDFRAATRSSFLFLDGIGLALIALATVKGLNPTAANAVLSIGSALLTIGISLPIANAHITAHSDQRFQSLNACTAVGIAGIFASRGLAENELKDAFNREADGTKTRLRIQAVALLGLLDPSERPNGHFSTLLRNAHVPLQVMILDPDSPAAAERARVEINGMTIEDIHKSLGTALPSVIAERLRARVEHDPKARESLLRMQRHGRPLQPEEMHALARYAHAEVRTLVDATPCFMMLSFQQHMFVEQYHLGRPEGLVAPAGCIGKRVPVFQYRADKEPARFFQAHFDHYWARGKDRTTEVLTAALGVAELGGHPPA